ncbi:GNAT family N-acetyltransferase [filamentous cyanobacterium CCP3]|nr:GNAT family N-acetyltransferase [filamentous cyanobacterium CCP3]
MALRSLRRSPPLRLSQTGLAAMSLRPYQPQDCEAVLDVWQRAATVAHSFLPAAHFAQERLAIATQYLPMAETWVYEHQGQIAGFVSLLNAEASSEVGGLFVDPPWQGRGVGRALMDHAVALKGALMVTVFEQNALGRRFYGRYGFGETGRSRHDDTGLPLVRMQYPFPRSPN